MRNLLMSVLVMGGIHGCSPCLGRKPSPELNREYYLPPSKITWREGEESPPLPERRCSLPAQDLDQRTPTTLCDRLRLSLVGICTASRWVWSRHPTTQSFVVTGSPEGGGGWTTPATGPNPLRRQGSFVDNKEPGLQHRTQVIDTRKRCISTAFPEPTAPPGSLYPYKSSSGKRQMIVIPGNNKPYAAKKSSRTCC